MSEAYPIRTQEERDELKKFLIEEGLLKEGQFVVQFNHRDLFSDSDSDDSLPPLEIDEPGSIEEND